jgi:hypothetical protein
MQLLQVARHIQSHIPSQAQQTAAPHSQEVLASNLRPHNTLGLLLYLEDAVQLSVSTRG